MRKMKNLDFEKQYASIYDFVKSKLEATAACHDFDHTLRVLHNAKMLFQEIPEADEQVICLAALLHDISRPEEVNSKGKFCHAQEGAVEAASLLEKYNFSQAVIEQVCACIHSHRFRGNGSLPVSLEAKIIYDADKLDSIGAIGIARAFHFAGRENARVHNTAEEALNSSEYSREDSAYREYLVKLRHISAKMLTSAGKHHAVSRTQFMDEFFVQIENEIKM